MAYFWDNQIISKVLQVNQHYLVENLSSVPLADYLFQENHISVGEKDQIHALVIRQAQNRELLAILPTKGDGALDAMLKYLKRDGTQPFLYQLLQNSKNEIVTGARHTQRLQPSPTNTNKVKLSYNQLCVIRDILLTDPNILSGWSDLNNEFLTSEEDKYAIDQLFKDRASIGSIILSTLQKWLSKAKQERGNLDEIIKILDKKELHSICDQLREQSDNI